MRAFGAVLCDFFPPWLFPAAEGDALKIDDALRKNVVFIGVWNPKPKFEAKATGFFVAVPTKFGPILYVVTAEHVVSGLATALGAAKEIVIRLNTPTGVAHIETTQSDWTFHPNAERDPTDVAVVGVTIAAETTEFLPAATALFLLDESLEADGYRFGIGDEVVVLGLFRPHAGAARNIPIVRRGSLAALPEEPVATDYAGHIKAYLVELHSIGGLSGSPVFIRKPHLHMPAPGLISHATGHGLMLLGVMHGHFDVKNLSDVSLDAAAGPDKINTGIGVVVPAHKILETLNHPDLQEKRGALISKRESEAARPDLGIEPIPAAKPGPPPIEGDERHKERFTALLDEAVQKPK